MKPHHISDRELAEMRDRALRLREKPNASGTARAVAGDLFRVTTLLLQARRGRGALRQRREQIEALNKLFYGE